MTAENTLKSEKTDVYDYCYDGWSDCLEQSQIDLAYYCGAQWTYDELMKAEDADRQLHTLDKTARQVNLLHGYEIRNRHILKIGPVGKPHEQEDEACRQHTSMIMALMANGGNTVRSNCFKWGSLVQGSNLLEFWRDRDGILRFGRLGWNQFLLDPALIKTNLSDCENILTGRWISKDKVKMLVPTADIDDITPLKFGERWPYLGEPALGNKAENRMYEEWWRRKTEYIPTVISRVTGQEVPFEEFANKFYNGDKKFANYRIKELRLPDGSPAVSKYNKEVNKVRLTVYVDNEAVWDGDNPLKMRDYNFVWYHGDWCPESPRDELKLRSFVRRIREPQRAFNRRMNQIYDIIESQIQSGRITRSKYLLNPEDVHKSGQGLVFHATDEFPDNLRLDDLVHQMTGSPVDAGLFQALELTDKAETDAGGLNQEIFGSDDKDIPGILHSYRTGQALTGQAGIFQGFRDANAQVGIKGVRLVQLNYSPQMVAQILNEMPTDGFYDEDLTRFSCTPVEGLLTDTQQMLFYQELKILRETDEQMRLLIPPSLLVKYFPGQSQRELVQAIKQAEQQQAQTAQRDKQMQDTMMQLQIQQTKGQIVANRGIAAAQQAKAVEDISDAALNRVKVLAEINDIGAGRILELVNLGIQFEQIKQQNREVTAKS